MHDLPAPIQLLSPLVANQIAAGEVVERPASVVKELVENSLDAGASRIEVEIEQAGRKRISVRDNGSGIRRDDLHRAVQRHATSKIATSEQLMAVASLGFRGEALASISSVARVEITSRPHDETMAWTLRCADSRCAEVEPAAHPAGTWVEVRELFHNLPARRQFLRTERTEFIHLEQMIRGLALSQFNVGFSLIHNQRQVLRVPPAESPQAREQRVLSLCGRGFLSHAVVVNYAASGLQLSGWLGRPSFSRSQRDLQYLFVNGRLVRDKLIGHAIRQGYAEHIPAGRFPAFVLHLQLDPRLVDVNVHPTKHEVRFRDSQLVHDFLSHCLREALRVEPQRATLATNSTLPSTVSMGSFTAASVTHYVSDDESSYSQPGLSATVADLPRSTTERVLAQFSGRYLLLESDTGLTLLNIQAAKAWLAATELTAMLRRGDVTAQPLLIPARVPLSAQELDCLHQHADTVATLGFDLSRVGEHSVMVRRIPTVLGDAELTSTIQSLPGAVAEWPAGVLPTVKQLETFTSACRFDISPQMSCEEQESLWGAVVRRCQADGFPAHVVASVSHSQLHSLFKHRQS